jgi:predicted XRE-type DNA-binding protein
MHSLLGITHAILVAPAAIDDHDADDIRRGAPLLLIAPLAHAAYLLTISRGREALSMLSALTATLPTLRPPQLVAAHGTPQEARLAVTEAEVRATLIENEQFRDHGYHQGIPLFMQSSAGIVDDILTRWLEDRRGITVEELLAIENNIRCAGDWRREHHGHDPMARERTGRLDLFRRMREERAAPLRIDPAEVLSNLTDSEQLAARYVDTDPSLPDIIRVGGEQIRGLFRRWLDDPRSVSAGELRGAIYTAEQTGNWRNDMYGDDSLGATRLRRLSLLRRMREIAERDHHPTRDWPPATRDAMFAAIVATADIPDQDSPQIASETENDAHPDHGIYPAIGIRQDEDEGAESTPMSPARRQTLIELGQGIEKLRLKRGLKQRELAPLVGLSQSHLSEVESGKREARGATIQALIRELRPLNADLASGEPEPL